MRQSENFDLVCTCEKVAVESSGAARVAIFHRLLQQCEKAVAESVNQHECEWNIQ